MSYNIKSVRLTINFHQGLDKINVVDPRTILPCAQCHYRNFINIPINNCKYMCTLTHLKLAFPDDRPVAIKTAITWQWN